MLPPPVPPRRGAPPGPAAHPVSVTTEPLSTSPPPPAVPASPVATAAAVAAAATTAPPSASVSPSAMAAPAPSPAPVRNFGPGTPLGVQRFARPAPPVTARPATQRPGESEEGAAVAAAEEPSAPAVGTPPKPGLIPASVSSPFHNSPLMLNPREVAPAPETAPIPPPSPVAVAAAAAAAAAATTAAAVPAPAPAPAPSGPIEHVPVPTSFATSAQKKIIYEIYTTEQTYVSVLQTILQCFLMPLRVVAGMTTTPSASGDLSSLRTSSSIGSFDSASSGATSGRRSSSVVSIGPKDFGPPPGMPLGWMTEAEVLSIFANVERIYDFHVEVLAKMSHALHQWDDENGARIFGECLSQLLPRFPLLYPVYCNNFDSAIADLTHLEKRRRELKDFLADAYAQPRCANLTLNSLLLTPVQRITRYPLLFRELLDKTSAGSAGQESLSAVHARFVDMAADVNRSMQESESARRLQEISTNIKGLASLLSSERGRSLIRDGPLALTTPRKPYRALLFKDCLVFALTTSLNQADVELVLPVDVLWVDDLVDLDPQTNNHDAIEIFTPERPYTIYAGTANNKRLWLAALRKTIAASLNVPENQLRKRIGRTFKYRDGSVYEGDFENGRRHGTGRLVYQDHTVYEGQWRNDLRHGCGKMTYSTSEEYEGNWKRDLQHGHGKLTLTDDNIFEGNWRRGQKDGPCTISFANGDMFTGFMKNDMIEGAGTLVCTNGASYRGPFRQSLFDGPNAELVYPNGEKYVGPFKAGLRHGPNGTMTYADGSVYHGDWRSDQRQGIGRLDGPLPEEFYQGGWLSDLRHHHGEQLYANGDHYEGSFAFDVRSGDGICIYSTKITYDGQWQDDLFHGTGEWRHPRGHIYIGEFHLGRRHGHGQLISPDGSNYEGAFKNGQKDGSGTEHLVVSSYSGTFALGKRHGRGVWSSTSTRYTGDWTYGRRNGRGVLNTESGKYEGPFLDDLRDSTAQSALPASSGSHHSGSGDAKAPPSFTTLVGTRISGPWKGDHQADRHTVKFIHGRTDLVVYKYCLTSTDPSDTSTGGVLRPPLAPTIPSILRPGVTHG